MNQTHQKSTQQVDQTSERPVEQAQSGMDNSLLLALLEEEQTAQPESGPSGLYVEAGGGLASLLGAEGESVGLSLSSDGLEVYHTHTTDGFTSEGVGGGFSLGAGYYSDKNKFEGEGGTRYGQIETPGLDLSVGAQRLETPQGEGYGWGIQIGAGAGLNPVPVEVGATEGETTFSETDFTEHTKPGPYEAEPDGYIPFSGYCEQEDGTWDSCS